MKNLPLAGFRPLLGIIFLFSCILGCRKDSLTPTGNLSQVNSQELSAKNFPISIKEAKTCFERLDAHPSTSFDNGESYTFLKTIEPDWNLAFIGHSQSGKQIVITPLEDSCLNALNQGRAGAKLIFSKINEDSVSVNILVFLADTSYYQGNAGALNFNTFTGLYLLLDVGQHFETGLNVIAGSPVGRVKSISQQGSQNVPDDREDAEDEDCPRTFESMLIPCEIVFACIDGFQLITIESADCTDAVWPTGGGGSGSGGGGGGGGGGTSTPNFWGIFYTNMPIEIFLQNGGILPPGLDITHAQHLIEINQVYHLSQPNLQWLADNILTLDAIYGYFISHPTPTGDDLNAVARLIELNKKYSLNLFQQLYLAGHLNEVGTYYLFAVSHNFDSTSKASVIAVVEARMATFTPLSSTLLTQLLELQLIANLNQPQLVWLINTDDAIKGISLFTNQYKGLDGVDLAAQLLTGFAASNNITNPLTADFSTYGESAFPCTPCLEVAWTVEYAILKRDQPCSPNDWICDWNLKARATWNVISSGVHLLLDGAGLIPGIGEIADLASGALYTLEGNYGDATLSFLAAIPFVGWTATGAKYARKVINVAGNAMELKYILRSADNVIEFGDRSQLRTILKTPSGQQAHHIIPWELQNHPVIQAAADVKLDAFHMNELLNGISLPTTLGGLPKHLGSHPNYSARVEAALDQIENQVTINGVIDNDLALQRLKNLANTIKNKVQSTTGGTIDDVTW